MRLDSWQLGLTLTAAAAVTAATWGTRASGSPPREPRAAVRDHKPETERAEEPTRAEGGVSLPPFERYQALFRRNPFAPRLSARPAAAPTTVPTLPPADAARPGPAAGAAKPPEPPPGPPDPLKDWVYSGTVVIGPDVYAIVENRPAKRMEYLREEQSFQGGTVVRVAQTTLLLQFGDQTRSLPKSTAFNATPLNAPTPAAAPGGAVKPGAPAAPGAAPARPGAPAPAAPGASPAAPQPAPAPTAVRVLEGDVQVQVVPK